MEQTFWLEPVRRGEMVRAILHALSGDARVAVEVEPEVLERLRLLSLPSAQPGLVAPFSRHGPGSMVVLPLRDAADAEVTWRALAPGLVRPVQIEAIQVERNGTLEFLAADRLHHECVSVGRAVPEEFLKTLQHQGIIRRYYKATAGRSQSSMQ